MKMCSQCSQSFSVTNSDVAFYERISVSEPTLCPLCRQQRRLAFRNERNLFERKCDFSGRNIISLYPVETQYKVYGQDVWWGDAWDSLSYGQEFDFNRPFFEQFDELMRRVPRIALSNKNAENSEYIGIGSNNRNCYLSSPCFNSEDCLYGASIYNCKNTVDSLICEYDEICYDSINCQKCYSVFFSQDCIGCSDIYFSKFCKSCNNCFGCYGLLNASYHIYNQPVSKEKFKEFLGQALEKLTHQRIDFFDEKAKETEFLLPHPAMNQKNTENCVGDNIQNSRNCFVSFDVTRGEDLKYCYRVWDAKDSYDASKTSFGMELCYEVMNAGLNLYAAKFCTVCWTSDFLDYCDHCFNSSSLFGCIGLKHQQYCIFNKKYPKESFDKLRAAIIGHMKKTKEYGEFFPISISPFAYNETTAQDYFPLTKEGAFAKGYQWKSPDKREYLPQIYKIPDIIREVPSNIINKILSCVVCSKNFRIIPQELEFYRRYHIPIPNKCSACRHLERLKKRNPRRLWTRVCMKCGIEIQTSYAPERQEKIYCKECYLQI